MDGLNLNAVAGQPSFEVLDRFNSELDRFERILSMTETFLSPILLQHETPAGASPQEVQYHPYHGAILRLEALNNRAEDLRSRIRL